MVSSLGAVLTLIVDIPELSKESNTKNSTQRIQHYEFNMSIYISMQVWCMVMAIHRFLIKVYHIPHLNLIICARLYTSLCFVAFSHHILYLY